METKINLEKVNLTKVMFESDVLREVVETLYHDLHTEAIRKVLRAKSEVRANLFIIGVYDASNISSYEPEVRNDVHIVATYHNGSKFCK